MKDNVVSNWREENGISQRVAARILGVDQSQISRWESGKREVPRVVVKLIDCIEDKRFIVDFSGGVR